MLSIESLKRTAIGLGEALLPRDPTAVAKTLSDLCEHLSTLGNEVSELRERLQDAEKKIAQLQQDVRHGS